MVWEQSDGTVLHGLDAGAFVDGGLSFPIGFAGRVTAPQAVTLRSSARDTATYETVSGVRFYLSGSDLSLVQETWPYYGDAFTPARPELNGGFELSFDGGTIWNRFSREVGYKTAITTGLWLPAIAIGATGLDATLGPFDLAHMLLRFQIPAQDTVFKKLDIQLNVDCDIF